MSQPSIVESILAEPAKALNLLRDLAQQAARDSNAAALLSMLPVLLEMAGEAQLASLAKSVARESTHEMQTSSPTADAIIPNPYVVGTPLPSGSPLFFGRADLLVFIGETLANAHRSNLVLIGQRRTGKSSLLKQLPLSLGDAYMPVYLDGQSIVLEPGLGTFFFNIATEISYALEDRGFCPHAPALSDFVESPAHAFEHEFLRQVRKCIGGRHLVLMLDEFEELEAAAQRGHLEPSVFGFLRHLIQHGADLSMIFCGTRRMEDLAPDHWNVLFNTSLVKQVGFLARDEALRLITEPVAPYGMHYDLPVLSQMWALTFGHPYFLQLLCHSLVNQHNQSGQGTMTAAHLNPALEDVLASGEAHFIYLWAELGQYERLALTALSRMMPLDGQTSAEQVRDYLATRGGALDQQTIRAALHRLALRDILSEQVGGEVEQLNDTYTWRLGVLGLWVRKFRSLSGQLEELNA